MTKTARKKILGGVLTLLLLISSALPVFAATFHIDTNGGQAIENVATVSNDYIAHLTSIQNSAFDRDQVSFTGTGWRDGGTSRNADGDASVWTECIYKLASGTTTENLKVTYPKYLKVGAKEYDVVFEVTGTATDASQSSYAVRRDSVSIRLNFLLDGVYERLREEADTEASWKITIYDAGTNNVASIKNLHMRLADLDITNYGLGGDAKEAMKIDGFTASRSNTYVKEEVVGRMMYKNGTFYGIDASNNDVNAFVKVGTTVSSYYGYHLTPPSNLLPMFGSTYTFYVTKHNVYYNTDGKGTVSRESEKKFADENPSGSVDTPNSGYYLDYWTVDKVVSLEDGTTIPAGGRITEAQIKNVLVNSDLTFTAHHAPYLKVSYEWVGPHPGHDVPGGKTDIKSGDEYSVDTSFTVGQTEKGTKDGQKGTWTFEGWDKNGTLEITEDTVIKGTWSFVPEYDITTDAVNGTITETETDIPEGQNRVITYSPNEGYQILSLTVDGETKDPKEYPSSYTFNDIHSDHDVKVVYEKIPSLAIEKTADKEIFNAGDTVTYTIKVSQTVEGAEARNVKIVDTLPEGLTLNKDSFQGDVTIVRAEDNEYELSIPSIETEITYTYTAVTSVDADAEELINIAEASAENVPGDPARDDATVKSLLPKPEITKVVSNEHPAEGEEITYTISVKEPQEGITLRNAVMTDPIPEGIEALGVLEVAGDGAEATLDGNLLTLTVPELTDEVVVSIKAVVTATTGQIDNVATLTGDSVDPVSDNALIEVKEPEPKLVKSVSKEKASIGDIVTYTIVASSDIPLKNAVITDTAPQGIEVMVDTIKATGSELSDQFAKSWSTPDAAGAGTIVLTFEELKEATITYQAKVTEEGDHINIASLTADNFPNGPLEDEAKVVAAKPKAIIEKSVSAEEVYVGDTVSYQINAYASEGTVHDAVIEDALPDGITLNKDSVSVSAENAKIDISDGKIVVRVDALTSEALVISYTAEVTKKGRHTNVATLTGSNLDDQLKAKASVNAIVAPVAEEPSIAEEPPITEEPPVDDETPVTTKETPPSRVGSPKTGDSIPVLPFIAFGIAGVALAAFAYKKNRSKDIN